MHTFGESAEFEVLKDANQYDTKVNDRICYQQRFGDSIFDLPQDIQLIMTDLGALTCDGVDIISFSNKGDDDPVLLNVRTSSEAKIMNKLVEMLSHDFLDSGRVLVSEVSEKIEVCFTVCIVYLLFSIGFPYIRLSGRPLRTLVVPTRS